MKAFIFTTVMREIASQLAAQLGAHLLENTMADVA